MRAHLTEISRVGSAMMGKSTVICAVKTLSSFHSDGKVATRGRHGETLTDTQLPAAAYQDASATHGAVR